MPVPAANSEAANNSVAGPGGTRFMGFMAKNRLNNATLGRPKRKAWADLRTDDSTTEDDYGPEASFRTPTFAAGLAEKTGSSNHHGGGNNSMSNSVDSNVGGNSNGPQAGQGPNFNSGPTIIPRPF